LLASLAFQENATAPHCTHVGDNMSPVFSFLLDALVVGGFQ